MLSGIVRAYFFRTKVQAGCDHTTDEDGEDGIGFNLVFDEDLERVRCSASMVVCQSCSGFISPRPLKRWTGHAASDRRLRPGAEPRLP